MPKFNAELLLVIEADSIEEADSIATGVRDTAQGMWSLKGKVVDASVEAVAEKHVRESTGVAGA